MSPPPPSPSHHLRSIAALDLVRHRSSFTPMDPSKDYGWSRTRPSLLNFLRRSRMLVKTRTSGFRPARFPCSRREQGSLNIFRGPFSPLPRRTRLIKTFLRSFRSAFPDISSSMRRVNAPRHIIIGRSCTLFN